MAKTTRRHVDHHGATSRPVEVPTSAMCELGFCRRCKGEVLSLLYPVGTACQHGCHPQPLADLWERLDASEAGALSNPFGGEAA
jgi:hypothetical protein